MIRSEVHKAEYYRALIDTQLASGYHSSSGFRDAFSRIMGAPPTQLNENRIN